MSSRMEKNFQNSLEFKPERFMVDSEATDAKYFFSRKVLFEKLRIILKINKEWIDSSIIRLV